MKAAVCKAVGQIVIEEVPTPSPGPGEVLVEVQATGLCGSDLDGYLGRHPMIELPKILGHECSGIVAELGPDVSGVSVGDEVVVEPFFTCKRCKACLRGQYNLCEKLNIVGHERDGSLAEYCIAEAFFLHPKPPGVSFGEAAIVEPLSGSLHAIQRCNLRIGDFVVIIGCGTIGSLALQHAKNAGAEVLIADVRDYKLDVARQLGADHVLNVQREDLLEKVSDLTGGVRADCVVEAVGLPETLAQTVGLVRRGGTIMLIGWSGAASDPFDLTAVTLNELTVLGTLGFAFDHATALRLLAQGKVQIAPIISHHLPLAKVEDGLKMLHEGADGVWKIVIG